MKPTNQQIKEFWKRCKAPYRTEMDGWDNFGYPPIDLNNLFKYAVPILKNSTVMISGNSCYIHYDTHEYSVYSDQDSSVHHSTKVCYSNDPALALFWALWEVLK